MASIIATNSSNSINYEPLPAGSYPARCFSMILIGTITEEYQGQMKTQTKVRIAWETPTELKVFKEENGEQPYALYKEFTLSMHEKGNLRKFLEAWRGKNFTEEEAKAFDITALLGKPCLLSVKHREAKDGKIYADIAGVNLLPKGLACPEQINPTQVLTFDDWDENLYQSLSEKTRERIASSKEYQEMRLKQNNVEGEAQMAIVVEGNDEPPF